MRYDRTGQQRQRACGGRESESRLPTAALRVGRELMREGRGGGKVDIAVVIGAAADIAVIAKSAHFLHSFIY